MLKRKHFLLILMIIPELVLANAWLDLWFNKNQQGSKLLRQNKNQQAAETFTDSKWKGVAYYRDKQYAKAYTEFKKDNSAQGLYNQGNALAQMQRYQEALNAYNEALKYQKNFPDAEHNIKVVKKLLAQQKQQKSSQNNSESQNKSESEPNQNRQQQSQNNQKQNEQNKQQNSQQNKTNSTNNGQSNKADTNKDNNSQSQNQNSSTNSAQQNKSTANNNLQNNAQNNQAQQQRKAENNNQNFANSNNAVNNQNLQSAKQKVNGGVNSAQAKASENKEQASQIGIYQEKANPDDKQNADVKAALSQIPDDPGGLLKNKFLRDYQKQKQEGDNE